MVHGQIIITGDMKRTPIKQVGQKGRQWQQDRLLIIKQAVREERVTLDNGYVEGNCEDCKKWKPLTLDHRLKRSQGGTNDYLNIDFVCLQCHDNRDNKGDPMSKKERKTNKAKWMNPHKCIHCKRENSGLLLCPHCEKISVPKGDL